jgi:hypothetical protein
MIHFNALVIYYRSLNKNKQIHRIKKIKRKKIIFFENSLQVLQRNNNKASSRAVAIISGKDTIYRIYEEKTLTFTLLMHLKLLKFLH